MENDNPEDESIMNKIKAAIYDLGRWAKRNRFYLSLGACILVIGGALYWARGRVMAPAHPLPAPAPTPVASSYDERLDDVKVPSPLAWPVTGRDILSPHSPIDPAWSDTLELWQTHSGVDIAAIKGEMVYAAIDGTVSRAERDALYGCVIEVTGPDRLLTRYANLATTQLVKVGDRVKAGDPIGAVGDTSALESSMRAHLHFEAYQDGEWIELS